MKKRFIKELVLVVLDLDKKMKIEVNVLDYATGEVLSINTSSFSLKISKWDRKKLQDSW